MRTYLIAITGASSSGKSTICKVLCNIIPNTYLIQQDAYFKAEKDVPFNKELQEYDWDCSDAIDMPQMVRDLQRIKEGGDIDDKIEMTNFKEDAKFTLSTKTIDDIESQLNFPDSRIVFVDGFLMLNDPDLMKLFDLTLFIKTGYSTLKSRREGRVYKVDGEDWLAPAGYFDQFVWRGYYKYHKSLFSPSDQVSVAENGGNLLEAFKSTHNIVEFSNNDHTDFDLLILSVFKIIRDFITI